MASGEVTRRPPLERALHAEPVEMGGDLRAAAVHHDRAEAGVPQEHHVLREFGAQVVVGHGVAAVLDHPRKRRIGEEGNCVYLELPGLADDEVLERAYSGVARTVAGAACSGAPRRSCRRNWRWRGRCAVVVEIGQGNVLRRIGGAEAGLGGKGAVAVAGQKSDRVLVRVDDGEVGLAVAIEVGHEQRSRHDAGGEGLGRRQMYRCRGPAERSRCLGRSARSCWRSPDRPDGRRRSRQRRRRGNWCPRPPWRRLGGRQTSRRRCRTACST